MKTSLYNQDTMILELAESRSQDQSLKERLDEMARQQEGFGQLIVEIFSSATSSPVRSNASSTKTSFELELMNTVQNAPQGIGDEDVSGLQMSASRLAYVQSQFIDIFRYDSMFHREAHVAEAHPSTLKWIFDSPRREIRKWDNFSQWLESEGQLYWITGKMGSGKSTLMKYISEEITASSRTRRQRRCTPYLLRWAKDKPLFFATFYFWAGSNEETRIQTSVEGLYRTIITQILEAYPDAAPRASPRRWESLCLLNRTSKQLDTTELKVILSNAIDYVSSVAKVCLFIDGLDEFEGDDNDLRNLVTWLKKLLETSQIKLCVASRPWRVFEDALLDRPHLRMEDFNFDDIQKCVWQRFNDDPNFRAKKQVEAAFCNQLLDEIVTKAEGVFLWVHIVCTNLLHAMSRGELVSRLSEILKELPEKMERLYDHIIDNLEPCEKDHAAKYFLLMQASSGQPDALIFSFADDIDDDDEFSLRMRKKSLANAELQYRVTELRKRLNSRCRGLLSLSMEALYVGTIQYCHRSTKDYLTMVNIQKKLIDMLHAPFDAQLRLCSAHLAWWKCATYYSRFEQLTSLYTCAEHAAKVASESHDMMVRILDELKPDFNAHSYIDDDHFGPRPWFGANILSFAVVLGVNNYVKSKVGRDQGCVVHSRPIPRAWHKRAFGEFRKNRKALSNQEAGIGEMQRFLGVKRSEKVEWPLLLDAFLGTKRPDSGMVSLLLENGADPNLTIRGEGWEKSALNVVLDRLMEGYSSRFSEVEQACVDSICLLLQHGAKPHRSYVRFLWAFLGEELVHAHKLPHLGRHRKFISDLFSLYGHKGKR